MRLRLVALVLILLILPIMMPAGQAPVPVASAAAPPQVWKWRNPALSGVNLEAVAHGEGLWVAVGNHTLLTSPDTIQWIVNDGGGTAALHDVLYANGQYVAVGQGVILTSVDGRTWVRKDGPAATDDLRSVTFANGRFVAVGTTVAMVSLDGATWTRYNLPWCCSPNQVAGAEGIFVIVGVAGGILTSTDGAQWVQQTSPTTEALNAVTYWNGRFVAAGRDDTMVTSTDGLSWQRVNSTLLPSDETDEIVALVPFKGRLMALSQTWMGAFVLSTPDGVTWQVDSSAGANALATDGNLLVSAGGLGTVRTSSDGIAWSTRLGGIKNAFTDVAYGGGRFVAVGRSPEDVGGIYSSDDGTNWVLRVGDDTVADKVAYGAGRFVALAWNAFYISADGITWASSSSFGQERFSPTAITYAGGQFVAVTTDNHVLLSPDGQAWEKVDTTMTGILRTITYGDGLYVAAGHEGILYTSPDGRVWTAHDSGTTYDIVSAAHGNGRFVLGGSYYEVVVTSVDGGRNWTSGAGPRLDSILFAEGQFVGAGDGIQVSSDGVAWRLDEGTGDVNPWGIAYGSGQYVAVAPSGAILTTGGEPAPTTFALPDSIPDPSRSTLVADRTFLPLDHSITATITVTLRDAVGRPVAGRLVELDQTWTQHGAIADIRPRGAITGADGTATFTVSPSLPRLGTIGATDLTDNVRVGTELPVLFASCEGRFTDVTKSAPGCRAVEELAARKIMVGDPDGTFQSDRVVTQAELLTILTKAIQPNPQRAVPDVPGQSGHQAAPQGALGLTALAGFPDGSLRPDAPVTRAMLIKAVMAAIGFAPSEVNSGPYQDIATADWYRPWVAGAYRSFLLSNRGVWPVFPQPDFRGDQPVTRMEAAQFVANAMVRKGWIHF